jgi:hypothetical protein
MSRKDFSQQFPTHRDFSQQFPTHRDFSQQFPSHHDFFHQFSSSRMIPNELVNTLPEDIFPVFTPDNELVPNPPVVQQQPDQPVNNPPVANQPIWRGLTDEELFQQDMQELLHVQAAEESEAREREAYLKGKEDRRNRRAEWQIRMGLPRVPSSEDDSSASDAWDCALAKGFTS